MNIYAIDKLMSETRRLAAEYHRLTGLVLPVSNELSRHDVMTKLNFIAPTQQESGVDLIGTGLWEGRKIQVTLRVVFKQAKSRPRVGQLNFEGKWEFVILVLMNEDYAAEEMYIAKREALFESIYNRVNKNKERIAISIGKFKTLSELIWCKQEEMNEYLKC